MLPVPRRHLYRHWSDPVDLVRRELDRALGGWGEGDWDGYMVPVDMDESNDRIFINAEMPGFRKKDINVTIEDGAVNITAERQPEKQIGTRHLAERRYARVQRRISLPVSVDESDVTARLEDGVLHIELKKSAEAKGRLIPVE